MIPSPPKTDRDVPDPPPALARDPFDVSWRERVAVLGGLGTALVIGALLGMHYAPAQTRELFAAVVASTFAVGKFLPLWSITGKSHFGPYELGLVIGCIDTLGVLVLVYGLEGLYRFRRLKFALSRVQKNAQLVLRAYPGIRRAAVVCIVLFVLFPVAGTGAWAATFLGILLGVHRVVLISAVSFGGFLGGFGMAFVADQFGDFLARFERFQSDPVVKYGVLAVLVVLLATGVFFANRAYQNALASTPDAPEVD